jgi:hypothetical protein
MLFWVSTAKIIEKVGVYIHIVVCSCTRYHSCEHGARKGLLSLFLSELKKDEIKTRNNFWEMREILYRYRPQIFLQILWKFPYYIKNYKWVHECCENLEVRCESFQIERENRNYMQGQTINLQTNVTDLINALPGNGSVNTVEHTTI